MTQKHSSYQSKNQMPYIALIAICVAIITIVLALYNPWGRIAAWFDPGARALLIQQRAATLPARVLFQYGLVAVGISGIAGLSYHAVQWVRLRARLIHRREGLAPLVATANGLYDPDRDNAGAHPGVTAGALAVQRTAAGRALRTAEATQSQPDQAALPAPPPPATELPTKIGLNETLSWPPTINRLMLGLGSDGPVTASLHDLMHVLAVGSSGWGKSKFLALIIAQLAQAPERFDVAAIDVSGSAFNPIREWARLIYPVAREPEEAISILVALRDEVDHRKELFEDLPLADALPSYNRLADEPLSPIICLVDEGADLLSNEGVAGPLERLLQTGRQYGIYVLATGQSATADVIATSTRNNFSSRFVFHVESSRSVRTVLGRSEDPPQEKGRALVRLEGRPISELQVPLVSRRELYQRITAGGPSNSIPTQPHSIAESVVVEDDPELPEDERIELLYTQGVSLNEIQQRVFGYTGGSAYARVKEVTRGIDK